MPHKKISKQSAIFYLLAFLVPICIYSIIILSYQFGLGKMYVNSFSYLRIPMLGISSMSFAYYLRHTHMFRLADKLPQFALSISYGLSSYILAQESNALILLAYSLFPVLFLTYEWMISDQKHIPFIIGNAILLLVCPIVGIPVTILLYLLSFFDLSLKKRLHFGDFLHTTGNFLLSILTGSFGIIFYLAPYYANHTESAYEGFHITNDFTFFLSRLLPGSMPAQQFLLTTNKIDLYFGLTAMVFAVLFFFQNTISLRKKVYYAAFTLVLIAGIELSPLQYLLNLFITSEKDTITFSFLLIFWLLRLACESFGRISHLNKSSAIITSCIVAAITGISWCFGQHNFLFWMIIVHIILWSIITLFLLCISRIDFSIIRKILFCVILLELCFNTVITTNSKARPKTASVHAAFFCQKNKTMTAAKNKSAKQNTDSAKDNSSDNSTIIQKQEEPSFHLTTQEYHDYINKHTNKETNELLTYLSNQANIDPKNETENKTYLLSNNFERFNILCHQFGIKDNLFSVCKVSLEFPENPDYTITDLGHQIYHITCPTKEKVSYGFIPYSIHLEQNTKEPIYLFDNISGNMIELDEQLLSNYAYTYQQTTIEQGSATSVSCQILFYSMNMDIFRQLSDLLQKTDSDQAEDSQPSYLTYDIIGVVCSYIGGMILLLLLFYNEKEQIYQHLYQVRIRMTNAKIIQRLAWHVKNNKIYYLSFLLPAIMFLCIYIYIDCVPFGPNSIFDEDGFSLVLPEIIDYHYNAADHNTYLSMQSGYATNTYSNTPLIKLYQCYQYLTPSQIIFLQHLLLLLGVSFAGVTMVFYLTHRSNRPIPKQDIRLLFPAIIYSSNAFMLRCHSFTNWYYIFLLFPLLLILFQRLLVQKKWFAYTALLSLSMILHLQTTLYVCIFLVICFFCHPFANIKDLLTKGIRFAWTSLLAAGCSFFIIANTLIATRQVKALDQDASFPLPGLHGNFLTEWKNYMIFSPSTFVSKNNGDLFAYCGILTLLLTIFYFIYKKYKWQEKIRRLIPILFLSISFNGKILSYVWNGMHYQALVPNRYTFLLLFLLAETAYDGLAILQEQSRKIYSCVIIGITLFFLSCQSHSGGNTNIAFLCTMVLCLFYLCLHLWYRNNHCISYTTILLCMALLEFYCNALFTAKNWSYDSISRFGNYDKLTQMTTSTPENGMDFYRCIYPGESAQNASRMYHTYSNGAFSSYLSKYQLNLNRSHGFHNGGNFIDSRFVSDQMGLALSSTRYIYLYCYGTAPIPDLSRYRYIGYYDGYYIYENPCYLSLGFQVPESALHYNEKFEDVLVELPPHYHNFLAQEFLTQSKNINAIHTIELREEVTDEPDTFYITDEQNHILTYQETLNRLINLKKDDNYKIKLHINYYVPCDGNLYLYAHQTIGLGYAHQGEIYHTTINLPSIYNFINDTYYMGVSKEDVFQEFYQNASQNQLEDIQIKNDTITGTTNYDEDGYTMLSIPYDKGWTAFIDGKEVAIENPYDAGIYVKTPAGKHTLTLKFEPYGMKTCQQVTLIFWIFTLLLAVCGNIYHKRHHRVLPTKIN